MKDTFLQKAKKLGLLEPKGHALLANTIGEPSWSDIGPKVDTVPELLTKLINAGLGFTNVATNKHTGEITSFTLEGEIWQETALTGLVTWAYNNGKVGD